MLSKVFLAVASLVFYSWWNIVYLPLILVSIVFNYILGTSLVKSRHRLLLITGILLNLFFLGYFKYSDFFIENINFVFSSEFNLLNLALPLAISFFTFQQIAYLVDSYRGETQEYSFLNYSVFVLFFPQLIAGPIVHHKEMMPQFANTKNKLINYKNIALGLFIFSIGLFKKVIIADTFAVWATHGFDVMPVLNTFEAWVTSLSYTFQLYFDFSGYTDMAIGSALLFNIRLPMNFNMPYKATSIQDFWRRWHITLSRFLRDYIYIPLGGSRTGKFRIYINLIITFLLGGIWHGAGWTFVLWGLMHGIALVIHRVWQSLGFKLNSIIAWFITFNFVNIAWVFFRATNWSDAIKVLTGMFGLSGVDFPDRLFRRINLFNPFHPDRSILDESKIIWLLIGFVLILLFDNYQKKLDNTGLSTWNLVLSLIMLLVSLSFFCQISEFLYFNF